MCVSEFIICLLKWNIISLSWGIRARTTPTHSKRATPKIFFFFLFILLLFFVSTSLLLIGIPVWKCERRVRVGGGGKIVVLVRILLNNNCFDFWMKWCVRWWRWRRREEEEGYLVIWMMMTVGWRKFVYTWWITLFLFLWYGISRDSLNDFCFFFFATFCYKRGQ